MSALTPASLLTVDFIDFRIEELAAVVAESFAEEEERIAGVDDARAIQGRLILVRQEAGDVAELLVVLRHGEIVAVLLLEGLLVFRIFEKVLAVIGDEHVAIDDEAVDLAVIAHPILEGRIDVVHLALDAVLLDIGIEIFNDIVRDEIGEPRRRDQQGIIAARSGLLFEQGLRIDFFEG